MSARDSGSSPLARGTLDIMWIKNNRCGLIPARAGNTRYEEVWCCVRRAHPRSRGEHSLTELNGKVQQGSSPLARGTPPEHLRYGGGVGLIPARAGNTGGMSG